MNEMTRDGLPFAQKVSLAVAASFLLSTCGTSTSTSTPVAPTAIAVKRYLGTGAMAGTLDTGFGGSGAVSTKIDPAEFEYALAVALQSDGKILAAGRSALVGQGVIALVRYNTDGSLDTASFGTGGIVRTAVPSVNAVGTAVVLQGTQILVAGSTFVPSAPNSKTGTVGIVLARYNANGTLDAGFGPGGLGFVNADIGPGTDADVVSLALQSSSIIVAGATSNGNFVLRRYDSTGALDPTFGTNGTVTTSIGTSTVGLAIALQSTGKIVAAGGASGGAVHDSVLVRYNADGAIDLPFGGFGTGMVITDIGSSDNFANAVVVQPADDKIVVVGHANVNINADTSDIAVMRYNADGTPDSGFGANGTVVTDVGAFDNAFSLALQTVAADLKIVVSGNASVRGITRVAMVRYNSSGTLDPTFNTAAGGGIVTTLATGPSAIASGNAVAIQSDGGIVVAGYD